MNNQSTHRLTGNLGLIFIALSMGIILLIFVYFYYVLQPRLHEEAQSQANLLTQSLSRELMHKTVLDDAFLLQREVGKILLYNDEKHQKPFVKGIKIEFNPEFFPNHNRSLQRGESNCQDCFKVVTPLYDQHSLELLASVTYYVNPENYDTLLDEISRKFFFILSILAMLLFVIWSATQKLWKAMVESQQKLYNSNRYNQQILNTMQDMLFLIDHQGRILDANLSAQQQLEVSLEILQSHFIQEYFQTSQKNQRLLSQLKNLGQESLEVNFQLNPNVKHFGLLSASRFDTHLEVDGSEDTARYLLVIKDIDALKTAEAKLAYQAQMAHASRLKSLGEMATGIAHEINQPLAVIRLGAEGIKHSLQGQNPQAFEVEIAQDVIDQVDRATQIINNMRSFARLQPSPKRWVEPQHPLNSALSFFKEQLRINSIELVEYIDTSCPQILIETQKFEQVIVNLITNARHALSALKDSRSKKIEVKLNCDHQFVTLVIEDNGIGMDEMTRQHCLDPFFTTKEAGEGTGLGLSIVHNILQEFNINLMIQSELGKGTRFIMQIPHKLSEIPS